MACIVEKAGLHYAVIYEGVNPITGKERRRWRRCVDRAKAETLAGQLEEASEQQERPPRQMATYRFQLVAGAGLEPATFGS